MNNSEKLATYGTQYEEKQNKNTTQYVLDSTMRKHKQRKTRAPLQTTGGKDEPNINFMRKDTIGIYK